MTSSSPARTDSSRAGQAAKSITWARGRLVSRPGVAGLMLAGGSGRRTSRPNPSPARISPPDVRFSGRPSAASRAEISPVDSPCRRSSIARPRARSLAGAEPAGGPGFFGAAKQLQLAGPVLADQVDHRPAGVAEPLAGLGVGQPAHEVRAQRLVPALVHLGRGGKPPGSFLLRGSACHGPSARSPGTMASPPAATAAEALPAALAATCGDVSGQAADGDITTR